MKMLKRFIVKKNERGLLASEGDFLAARTGTYRRFDPYDRLSLESFSLNTPQFEHRSAGYLRQSEPPTGGALFHPDGPGRQRGRPALRGRRAGGAARTGHRRLYWKGQTEQRLERIDLTQDYRLSAALVAQLHQPNLRDRALAGLTQCCWSRCRRSRSACSRSTAPLPACCKPDNTGFWRYNRQVSEELVDTRIQALEVSGQEILTRDKVSLRLNPRRQLALQRRTHCLLRG